MKEVLKEIKIEKDWNVEDVNSNEKVDGFLIKDGIFIRNKGNLVKVKWTDILWLKGDGNYTTLVTRTQVFSLRNILKEFESVLPIQEFFRIHKSYIVRLDEIKSINPREVMIGNDSVPVGRTYFQDLINGIKKLGSAGGD
ncbi:LytR/AlgR family response regulator transcription factor [Aquiflexum gelatinilyticum]|jgi:DNA-binding LytR/AlgR family response regulator|uniref:LytTR family transcriptional regulator n=1 Tax=Aquiflexum gelatinilyticum TaxID=2961943 RepID=A0A9X2T241_9BACT|nr:LytTR family DNA-binding domain-containing protein [Aquiflexum gelatinilyticum]MCR9017493.1 LytTR family transcriptional regulator [Aquiflexum gelatinilyticum]MCS4434643.1 LytTR family transcriptional regulator [Aquiflexum gelatinilyticum]